MKSETTARKWLAPVLLAVVWVAVTCWLGYIHYFVILLCSITSIIGNLLGIVFYLVFYGVIGYMTAKHIFSWKQYVLLILLQTGLVFVTAIGSWNFNIVQLFRPWALFYVEDPIQTLLIVDDLGGLVINYGLAWLEMIILQIISIGVNKVVHKIQEKINNVIT